MLDYQRRGKRVRLRPGVVTWERSYHQEYGTILLEQKQPDALTLVSVEVDGLGQALFLEKDLEEVGEQ